MKYSEAINNFIHHVKQSTAQNNNQNFTKSLSSQPTKKYKPHRRHQNLNRLKGMNLYKLIDWNYVLIPMNRKKEKATEQRHFFKSFKQYLYVCYYKNFLYIR